MKIVTIEVKSSYGFANTEHRGELDVEIPEGLTPEEEDDILSAEAWQWAAEYVDSSYTRKLTQ